MNSERSIDRLVAEALGDAAPTSAPDGLIPDVLAAARRVRRRPRWIALLTERPMGRPPAVVVGSPAARTASVALALVLAALVGGLALFAGGALQHRGIAVVMPTQTVIPTRTIIPAPTTVASPPPSQAVVQRTGLVAYTIRKQEIPGTSACPSHLSILCTIDQVWLSNADGTDAHRLFADDQRSGDVLGWSPDGSRLLYEDRSHGLLLADTSGRVTQVLVPDAGCAPPPKDQPSTTTDFCTSEEGFALSPDGTRVAFVRSYANQKNATVVAILDLAAGTVRELAATRATNGSEQCWQSSTCQGMNDTPRWSPDGLRLVFARQHMSPERGSTWTSGAVFTIDADGSGLQRLTPPGMFAIDPSWSPDGATIAFTNVQMVVNATHTSVTGMLDDVYTVRANGLELQRLTTDGRSALPRWTVDGRLSFARSGESWVMDTDGGNEAKVGLDLGKLTAAGCLACLYPAPSGDQAQNLALWQPLP
jgi:Tol biopolymer transport system component